MKKGLIWLLGLVLLCMAVVVPVSADAAGLPTAHISTEAKVAASYRGAEVDFTVSFDSKVALKAMAITLDGAYDTTVFEYVSAEWLLNNPIIKDVQPNGSAAVIAFKEATEVSGKIFSFTLRVKKQAALATTTVTPHFVVKTYTTSEQALETVADPATVSIDHKWSNTTPRTCSLCGFVELGKPTVQVANTATGVKVTWKSVTGATSYKVYRSTYAGGKWSANTLYKTTTTLSYVDGNVSSNSRVRYTVYAYSGDTAGEASNAVEIIFLGKPSVSVSNTAAGASVTWAKVPGATVYNVYRSTLSGSKWSDYVRYISTSSLSYVDKNAKSGANVKYAVYAYSADGSRSALGTSAAIVRLSQPSVTSTNTAAGASVTWAKVPGATVYNVYRSTLSNGKWSDYVRYITTSGLSYVDKNAKSGASVKYAVYAYSADGSRSALGTAAAMVRLSQPTVTVTNAATGATVSWAKVTGATSYNVYRSTLSNGKWSGYVRCKSTTGLTYTDTTVKSGTSVKYAVYAYKSSYRSSLGTGNATFYLSQPAVKLAKATKGVKVSWGKVTGATSYKIYRSVYSGGKWTSYSLYKTTTSLTYTDTSIKAGTKVRYTVYACKSTYMSAHKTGVIITR